MRSPAAAALTYCSQEARLSSLNKNIPQRTQPLSLGKAEPTLASRQDLFSFVQTWYAGGAPERSAPYSVLAEDLEGLLPTAQASDFSSLQLAW